ncbi:MAG: peptidase E [Flavobacteriaceae bacterium]|nr:peptidase E [Flavobacteriaceae bacterium]
MRVFKLSIAVLIVLISLTSFMSFHKYYVSVTDIEYAAEAKSLQVISRLFVDDMEKVLQERYNDSIKIEDKLVDTYIEKYYSKKLLISIDNELKQFNFIGKEIEDDMVHCYFEIENISNIETISVTNKLLFDVFDSQQNITHLKINNKKKSFLFIKDNASGLLKL